MIPPYEQDNTPHEPLLTDMRLRTTYRCVRMECRMTVRLLDSIDRCSRCHAPVAVVEAPQLDLDEFVVEATEEIVAGFEALLRAA